MEAFFAYKHADQNSLPIKIQFYTLAFTFNGDHSRYILVRK